jgi:hypothetical protein
VKFSLSPSKTFFEHMMKSFWDAYGHIMAFLGLFIALFTYLATPSGKVPTWIFVVAMLVGLYLVIWFLFAAWSAFHGKVLGTPSVIAVKTPPKAITGSIALLLVGPSDLYSHDSVVTIYYVEEEFERPIGLGKVLNVQDNKIIQVLVTRDLGFDHWSGIIANDAGHLRRMRIKPTVLSTIVENYLHE